MPDISIPDRIAIPQEVAETVLFDGEATARDISYAVAVAWLGAQRDVALDGTPVEVGDNALRLAMGRTRRSSIEIEEERVYRMSRSGMRRNAMGEVIPLPSLTLRLPDGRVVINRNGLPRERDKQLQWNVDGRVGDLFRPIEDEPLVELPTRLLQFATHRATVPLMLRILAWCSGAADRKWIREKSDRWMVLRIPYVELVERLAIIDGAKPALVMSRALEPSCSEISELSGYDVTVEAIRTVYRPRMGASAKKTEGKVREVEFRIAMPEPEPITMLPGRVPGKTWKRPPAHKRHRTAPAPAKIDNVVPIPVAAPVVTGLREIASNRPEKPRTKLDPAPYSAADDWDAAF